MDYRFFTELEGRTDEATAFTYGEAKVLFDKSDIYVFIEDGPVKMCTVHDFSKHPNVMYRRLQKYAESQRLPQKS